MPSAGFENVWKAFGDVVTLRNLSLDVHDGELLVLVGASGCGKTTSLRILAGLETATFGRVTIGDRDVTLLPSGERDISMVFQGYALYPHMTVRKNLSFGPRMRHEAKEPTNKRIGDMAELLGLDALLDRKPAQLSGGQRQRVALGRALLRDPALFLLDEPLSNLDAALRTQMRVELIRLHRQVGTTTVYVTHDQVEALTMGDRVAIMKDGDLVQVGTPEEVYENPTNSYVAQFIGSPKINLTDAHVIRRDGHSMTLRWLNTEVTVNGVTAADAVAGGKVTIGIRPQDLHWASEAPQRCATVLAGRVEVVEPTGSETFVEMDVNGATMTARLPKIARVKPTDVIEVRVDPRDLYVFDADTGMSLIRRSAVDDDHQLTMADKMARL